MGAQQYRGVKSGVFRAKESGGEVEAGALTNETMKMWEKIYQNEGNSDTNA
jgi:hypothetical protein